MLTMLATMSLNAALSWNSATATTPVYDDYPLLWAGHQVSFGRRAIPFRGEVVTRTDTLVLARVKMDGSKLIISQTACAVRFGEVAGIRVHMDASALPSSRLSFSLQDDGHTFLSKSLMSWDERDIDGDGHPGMTIGVQAKVCDGDLYVANRSRTRAEGHFDTTSFRGNAKVKVEQDILGARGRCLSVVARNSEEVVAGPFAYVQVAKGTTCTGLLYTGWPIDAES